MVSSRQKRQSKPRINKKLRDKMILIIEDDYDLLWLMKKFLSINGFKVLTAVTAKEAGKIFTKNLKKINAVILDLSLPDKNGKKVCQEFKNVSPDTPIFITTGFEDPTQQIELEKIGVDGYLVKPYNFKELVNMLSKVA